AERWRQRDFVAGPPVAPAPAVQRAVDGDPVDPGREARLATEVGQGAERAHPGFLRPVLGQCIVTREAAHDSVHARRVATVQFPTGVGVAHAGALYELDLAHEPPVLRCLL